ncbi:zinc finger BED domain-containing protein 4-like [Camponotus floridanus]|uniref:zinc finger BED domain-containing protein 4-like n=1 Tax=Camponotus floridanus TaxID=104421 RepID=UPI000DC69D87|nr:zinc finger BED domain-containing protein 4-like [Camponotus floridanus]
MGYLKATTNRVNHANKRLKNDNKRVNEATNGSETIVNEATGYLKAITNRINYVNKRLKNNNKRVKNSSEMMALDAEPFALVERKGFQRLMNYLAPQYPLPCRTYFSEKIMPYLYKNLKAYIKEKLIAAKNISFSTDIWTSPTNNESFISLTAHFIRSDDMNREILVLSAKHFPGSHTGSNIGQILNDVMEEWQISSSQIHLILRDNASNMIIGTGTHFYF